MCIYTYIYVTTLNLFFGKTAGGNQRVWQGGTSYHGLNLGYEFSKRLQLKFWLTSLIWTMWLAQKLDLSIHFWELQPLWMAENYLLCIAVCCHIRRFLCVKLHTSLYNSYYRFRSIIMFKSPYTWKPDWAGCYLWNSFWDTPLTCVSVVCVTIINKSRPPHFIP